LGIRAGTSQQGTPNYKTANQSAYGSFGHSCLLPLQVEVPMRCRAGRRRLAHRIAEFYSALDGWISDGDSNWAFSVATLTGLVR
jgi:hypothetical protein